MEGSYKNNDFIQLADSPKERNFVYALGRGFELLRCFGMDERYVGVAELARRSGIPKPSVARLAGTLVNLGYLEFSPALSKYALGIGVLSLGNTFLASLSIRDRIRPLLQSFAEYAQANVAVGMCDRLSMIYIDSVRANALVDARRDVGIRLPITTTSIGRAYLAGLSEFKRSMLLEQLRMHDAYGWARAEEGVIQALYDYQRRGFCVSIGEWKKGVNAVAVPFTDQDGNYMVFGCSAAEFVLSKERLENEIGPRLLTMVKGINVKKYQKTSIR